MNITIVTTKASNAGFRLTINSGSLQRQSPESIYTITERRILASDSPYVFNLKVTGAHTDHSGSCSGKYEALLLLAEFMEDFLKPAYQTEKENKYRKLLKI